MSCIPIIQSAVGSACQFDILGVSVAFVAFAVIIYLIKQSVEFAKNVIAAVPFLLVAALTFGLSSPGVFGAPTGCTVGEWWNPVSYATYSGCLAAASAAGIQYALIGSIFLWLSVIFVILALFRLVGFNILKLFMK